MSNAGHYNPFRSTVASDFVGNDDTRIITSRSPRQPAKETYGRESIPPWLHKNSEFEKNLIQMPLVGGSNTRVSEAIGKRLAELVAPTVDCFVANHHATCGHAFRDDLSRESVATVEVV